MAPQVGWYDDVGDVGTGAVVVTEVHKDGNADTEPAEPWLPYKPYAFLSASHLHAALTRLTLLGDDPFLKMQAFNLGIVDYWLTGLEYEQLKGLAQEGRNPMLEVFFVYAQSQMWLFAVYELLRTWRQRCRNLLDWQASGGLEQELSSLEEDVELTHFGREIRAAQIRDVLQDPEKTNAIRRDCRRTKTLFRRLEALRVSLAKHEIGKKRNSVARNPGYARINQWCGAFDFEVETGAQSFEQINRRDIADEIRAWVNLSAPGRGDLA